MLSGGGCIVAHSLFADFVKPLTMAHHASSSHPQNNENRVLDVKPLRTLAPMFPAGFGVNTSTHSMVPPFVCVNPFASGASVPQQKPTYADNRGGNSGGVSGFANGYVNATPLSASQTPPSASTRRHFATVVSAENNDEDEDEDPSYEAKSTSGRRAKRAARRDSGSGTQPKHKLPDNMDVDMSLFALTSQNPREAAEIIMMTFDALRRRLLQLDEIDDVTSRPDLRAGTIMMGKELRVNLKKRIGPVPGIEIGDMFYFRFELCLVGLHAPSMAGIDYIKEEGPAAICIVSAGGYENDDEDVDVLVYSGQGGSGKHDRKQPDDQKLERGNLALEKSAHKKNDIRVVRAAKDINLPNGRIYIYDGLYKVEQSWTECSKLGFNTFKYKLRRQPGQRDGIAVWKMTQKWKDNPSSRGRVILQDISSGVEKLPVCLVNEVDSERGPNHFTYVTKVQYLRHMNTMKPLQGCSCLSVCLPGDKNCSCARSDGGDLPYSSMGLLVSRKHIVYECNSLCTCSSNCRNRVTQKGVKLHFEVFKTRDRGWGLRSWDPIRAGTFICEYTGEVVDEKVNSFFDDSDDDDYMFHATHLGEKASRWNHGPELLGESIRDDTFKPFPITISAKNAGNVARFMNHSCSPNVFWQAVQYDHGDEGFPHISFFALTHIPPMTELTYDYGPGEAGSGKQGIDFGFYSRRTKKCLCGSPNCRGVFG